MSQMQNCYERSKTEPCERFTMEMIFSLNYFCRTVMWQSGSFCEKSILFPSVVFFFLLLVCVRMNCLWP